MAKKRKSIFLGLFVIMMLISFYMCSANENIKNDAKSFLDVKEIDWFFEDVNYVSSKGLMDGTDENVFSPHEKTTRGMIVTILWRLDGENIENGKAFSDVSRDAYYHDAVVWASNHEIVSGYSETTFAPDDSATREQMAAIMYRYAKYKQYDMTQTAVLDGYEDNALINEYAVEAMKWVCANGIISGTSDITLSPRDFVQRCQVAAIIWRFCDKYTVPESTQKPAENTGTEQPTQKPVSSVTDSSGGGSSSGSSADKNESTPAPSADEKENEINKSPKITVNSVTAKPGETVQISAEVKNNPGILGMTLTASYNETYCTLESVESGDAFDGVLDFVSSKTLNSGVRFVWDGIDITENQIKDGTVLVMNFRINDDAPECKIPITLQCYEGDAVDRNLKTIPLQIESGSIIVKTN